MQKLRLIRILRSLDSKEIKRFRQYVHSPSQTIHKDTIRLFDLIVEHYPDFDSKQLDRKIVFSHLYPNKPFRDQRLRSLRMYLLDLLLEFITELAMERNQLVKQPFKLKALAMRNLSKDFEQSLEKERTLLEDYPYRDADYFLAKYHLEDEALAYQMAKKRWANEQQHAVIQSLDHFYLAEKLRYGLSVMNMQGFFNIEKEIPMFEELINYCKAHLEELPTIIQTYFHLLLLNIAEENNQLHYIALKELGFHNYHSFPPNDWLNIYYSMINYCHQCYLSGETNFLSEMLDIYAIMLERKLLLEDDVLSTHHYKNITTLGLRLGKYEWTETFINDYKPYISPQFREGIYSYNMANLLFHQQKYQQVLRLLHRIDFIDPFYRISYHILQLKVYYECNESEALLSLCESFRTFVRRKKELSSTVKRSYINFAQFVRALFMLKIGLDKRPNKLAAKIEKSQALTERQWVMEKLNEMNTEASAQ